jgi:hypothetical protein
MLGFGPLLSRLKDVGSLPIVLSLVLFSSSITWQVYPHHPVDKRAAIAIICEPATADN